MAIALAINVKTWRTPLKNNTGNRSTKFIPRITALDFQKV